MDNKIQGPWETGHLEVPCAGASGTRSGPSRSWLLTILDDTEKNLFVSDEIERTWSWILWKEKETS